MTILVRLDVFGLLKILLPKINISNLNTLLQRINKFSTVQNLKFCLKIQKFQEITPTASRFFENFRRKFFVRTRTLAVIKFYIFGEIFQPDFRSEGNRFFKIFAFDLFYRNGKSDATQLLKFRNFSKFEEGTLKVH